MALQGNGVVTIGETMALLSPVPAPRLRDGAAMTLGLGGAESNVAIALARLGCPATWISRVGDDDFGTLVVRELRAEGVTVHAERDAAHPTGLMVKEARGARTTRVRYYRAGSAAAQLSAAYVQQFSDVIAASAVLHVTGITPALGPDPRQAVLKAVGIARENNTLVTFDVNHRATLWSDEQAREALVELARQADLTFAGPEEAALLLGAAPEPVESFEAGEKLARSLAEAVGGDVVLKLGHLGAIALFEDAAHHGPTTPVVVTDAVGAGDAFVGGYLAALLDDGEPLACLTLANRLGGAVCQAPGDWEALPTRAELDALNASTDVLR
ncbi:sugar kinase [Kineosporia sp. NBRC 101677]|uniref:sugar kinase n=1 Tax=Kineosporia sp. NBRC 101677 TaxID=3032197 RepID=UPI0024A0F96A|nr:sugar kinase [Kineosporia sp. NBRC 101677]GLY18959.1 sugar kinase [Kineosporia sp. NBRC 101677]